MNKFSNARYDITGGVMYYILKIIQNSRLRKVNIPMWDDFIVHRVLDSFTYGIWACQCFILPWEINWTIDELISVLYKNKTDWSARVLRKLILPWWHQARKINNNNDKRFKLHKMYHQGNNQNRSSCSNVHKRGFKKRDSLFLLRRWSISRLIVISSKQWWIAISRKVYP